MRQSVQQRRSHLGISKHLRPFGKAQIGRDHNAGALIEFGQQVKQQSAAGLAKRQVAQLVEYYQVDVHQLERNLASLAMRFFLAQAR